MSGSRTALSEPSERKSATAYRGWRAEGLGAHDRQRVGGFGQRVDGIEVGLGDRENGGIDHGGGGRGATRHEDGANDLGGHKP